jgi:hypothetical protein
MANLGEALWRHFEEGKRLIVFDEVTSIVPQGSEISTSIEYLTEIGQALTHGRATDLGASRFRNNLTLYVYGCLLEGARIKPFGELFRERRKRAGLTQRELAARIMLDEGRPMSPPYLNDLEHNLRKPSRTPVIKQFAKSF